GSRRSLPELVVLVGKGGLLPRKGGPRRTGAPCSLLFHYYSQPTQATKMFPGLTVALAASLCGHLSKVLDLMTRSGVVSPWSEIEPTPPPLEGWVLTTGPPGKSLSNVILDISHSRGDTKDINNSCGMSGCFLKGYKSFQEIFGTCFPGVSDGKESTCNVIGEDNVAVPSHLFKVILARRSAGSAEPLALGAFVVPNKAIGFQPQLREFQVSLQDLEQLSGLVFFPQLDRTSDVRDICSVDTCKLLDFREFTLYLSTRKLEGARSVVRLEKVMENIRNAGIEPDEYFMTRYEKKLEELRAQERSGVLGEKQSGTPEAKPS
ncbi:hypothetical protein FD754_025038, partial [Muntiacus muntjak]